MLYDIPYDILDMLMYYLIYCTIYDMPVARGCGGVLNLTDGTVISPNYPNHYDHTAECDWIITVPQNARIALNFTDFQLESSSTCAYDYLEVAQLPYMYLFQALGIWLLNELTIK